MMIKRLNSSLFHLKSTKNIDLVGDHKTKIIQNKTKIK